MRMPLEILKTVVSTMDVARENVVAGRLAFDQDGLLLPYDGVLAYSQTGGRGQRGRSWFSPPGDSLYATYYFRHGLTGPQQAGDLALLSGVVVAETLQRLATEIFSPQNASLLPSQTAKKSSLQHSLGLKWPNDVLIDGKKVAGILIEMVKAPDGGWVALIGVGVNVRARVFPPEIAEIATSLALAGVENCGVEILGEQIAVALHTQAALWRDAGFSAILQRWHDFDCTTGRRYQTQTALGAEQGTAIGVDEAGLLRLQMDDGRVLAVGSASTLLEL